MEKILNITIPEDRLVIYANLKAKHNPEGSELRNWQLQELECIKAFDTFCKEHDIKYTLAYGSLLGAVRHKGFIPWDDDMDIWMMRKEYDKLHARMKGKHHSLTDKLGVAMGTRPTLWYPPKGYIDIFIMDTCPNNPFLRFIKQHMAEFINMLIKCRTRIEGKNFKKPKIWFVFMPIAIFASRMRWYDILRNVSLWFTKGKESKCREIQVYNECVSSIWHRYPVDACNEIVNVDFEGLYLPIYKGYDALLKVRYGNYMELPKEFHTHGIVD
jgi:lipopolysaccharide cholinephosphotransferase